jgi:hypothetical protein
MADRVRSHLVTCYGTGRSFSQGAGARLSDRPVFRTRRIGRRAWLVAIGVASALLGAANGAHAAIMLDPQFGFADRPGDFEARFVWDFPATGDDKAGPFTGNCGDGKKCWTVKTLDSSAPDKNDPKRSMVVFPQHSPGEKFADPGHGPNAANGVLGFFGIQRPPGGKSVHASTNRIAHGNHSDYFTGVLRVPRAGDLSITIKGRHEGPLKPFEASFTNFTDKPLTGYYQPSYSVTRPGDEIPNTGDKIPFGTVQPGQAAKREKLPKKDDKDPTDYFVVASGSATTQTTLAYLGTVGDDPAIEELELAPLTEMLAGPDGFIVPMLREINAAIDLYVFADLLQWLAAEATFSPLEQYDIVSGTNDLLPGFFVSTTPVSVNPDGSFVGTPYSGLVFAAAGIDGHVVPTPSTLVLLITGMLGLATMGWCWRRAREHRHWARRSPRISSRQWADQLPASSP